MTWPFENDTGAKNGGKLKKKVKQPEKEHKKER